MSDGAVIQDGFLFLLPALDLLHAAAGVFIQRNLIVLDHLRILALDEERIVLRIMLAGFRAVIPEMTDILIADHVTVLFVFVLFLSQTADFGIQVVAVLIV